MLKECYSHSLLSPTLHFAAHSHHPRPDVTRVATLQCWDDDARFLDAKWEHIFDVVLGEAQRHVARILDLEQPKQIAFATNTHEFVVRILSSFDHEKPLRILTTSSEFLSFSRQITRLKERPLVSVREISVAPFCDFIARLKQAFREETYDLIFFSQVFFDSGYRINDLEEIVVGIPNNTIVVIDGYHAFCAIPTSLRSIRSRVFYLAGGYKYAQYGEGACFLYVPPNCSLRPENTGWFAEFGGLENATDAPLIVSYPHNAFRFWGATFDPAGIYRLNAVMDWMNRVGLSIEAIHTHVVNLQDYFLERMDKSYLNIFNSQKLITPRDSERRGHFLSYDCAHPSLAVRTKGELCSRGVIVDTRGALLRIGFGLYHDEGDVDALVDHLRFVSKQL